MRKLLLSTLALGAMTTAALAEAPEPMKLTDGQMDQVSAGVLGYNRMNLDIAVVPQVSIPVVVNPAIAIGVLAQNIHAIAAAVVNSGNISILDQ